MNVPYSLHSTITHLIQEKIIKIAQEIKKTHSRQAQWRESEFMGIIIESKDFETGVSENY